MYCSSATCTESVSTNQQITGTRVNKLCLLTNISFTCFANWLFETEKFYWSFKFTTPKVTSNSKIAVGEGMGKQQPEPSFYLPLRRCSPCRTKANSAKLPSGWVAWDRFVPHRLTSANLKSEVATTRPRKLILG